MFSLENLLQQVFFGNSIEQYAWFVGILFFGFVFLRVFSRFFSRLLFKLFKQFSAEVKIDKFVELLVKPIELLLMATIIYWAINQLNYPFHEVLMKRKKLDITYFDVIDKLFMFFIIISINWIVL